MNASEFANARSTAADTQLRPPQSKIKGGQEDKPKIKQPPILSLRMAEQEPQSNKPLLPQNPGAARSQIRSPTANNQQAPYPPASRFYQPAVGYNTNQLGYGPGYNSYPHEPQTLFAP